MTVSELEPLGSSFRDPSGFVYSRDGRIFRQIHSAYADQYQELKLSGLLEELWSVRLLVSHEEVGLECRANRDAVAVIRPENIPTISYPYEWCFGQLKDAALCTLDVQKRALGRGLSLKDASAYNVQFLKGRPLLIDTLSFEKYEEGRPWIAYRQFCSHFLAPLALMAHVDVRLLALLRTNIDGIPLDLAARLLPSTTKLNPGLAMHVHLHARAQSSGSSSGAEAKSAKVSKTGLLALIDSLESTVRKLDWTPDKTVWANYYQETNYSQTAFSQKHQLVSELLAKIEGPKKICWDLGANDGEFSRIAVEQGFDTVAFDFDPAAVEKAYRRVKETKDERLLPLLQDLTNPSPDLGWAGRERDSLKRRGPADVILALALVHHLAIGNNVPLPKIAAFFADISTWAIVEFVGKGDSQVVRMLSSREDIFRDYSLEGFESAFVHRFEVVVKAPLEGMDRVLFLLRRKG